MPALLTVASTMMCPHGGTVTAIPGQTSVTAGAPVLRGSDTFLIAGCPFFIGPDYSPCLTVQWVETATRVKAGGDFVLNEASVGLCLAATQAPQGTALILQTQPRSSGL
jgi:hypothetical protein